MANNADPDLLASSSEANWSGSTLFEKAGYSRVQQDQVKRGDSTEYIHNMITSWGIKSFVEVYVAYPNVTTGTKE